MNDDVALSFDPKARTLEGKRGVVLGIANRQSIAYGCAAAFRFLGAELVLTYLNDRAKLHVEPIAEELEAPLLLPCDVEREGQLETVFDAAGERWGGIDFALHSIAFAPKEELEGDLLDSSGPGFARAMDISCHSFVRMARCAAPLMADGGTLFAMSYYGAEKVVQHYNVMGPVEAALEGCVRYLAHELGPRRIRVHAISPGPIRTRAASGISDFETMLSIAKTRAPANRLVGIEDVGAATAALATPAAGLITGTTIHVDGGYHIMG